jgi:hypothetical protein
MLPGGNSPASRWRSAGNRQAHDPALLRGAEPERGAGHAGDEHEQLGAGRGRELGRAAVLVDHGVDADEPPVARHDRDPAAAARDDEHARRREHGDLADLDDLDRPRARHHPPPAAPGVRGDRPAELGREPLRGHLVVERADRLRRRLLDERRVVRVDPHAGQDRRGRQRRVDRSQRLLEQVADLALRHRVEHVERERRGVGLAARLLQGERADLRPVAVGEHDLVRPRDPRDRRRGLQRVRGLLGPRAALVLADQRVAAERDDDPHRTASIYDERIASQIARAGRSDGLAHECG